ncbi:MAG: hypothetical protein ACK4FB_07995 [Brevundimonas sp.]|uniref:hypothetical protein n=1 Tax=Brevundimonas sp. TaxID=1871086 RepID=UPI00391A977D
MTRFLPLAARYAFTRWRLRRFTRPIDRQIATARRKHKPVNHLIAARQSFVHAALAGGRG